MRYFAFLLLVFTSCHSERQQETGGGAANTRAIAPLHEDVNFFALFARHPEHLADGFDFPVGIPDAQGYYNAQGFRENNHLGDDWNGKGGGNTDLGDPVHSIANGYVSEAYDAGAGWGNVARIVHCWKNEGNWKIVESLYAHLDTMLVQQGQWVEKGAQIGTIGNAGGLYYAHLHLEIRTEAGKELGGGYAHDTAGYLNPTVFIRQHRSIR